MDQVPLELFRKIITGASWDDCWVWQGEMTSKRPVAHIDGELVWLRSYLQRIVHPSYTRPRRLKCDPRCVHPDHAIGLRRTNPGLAA